jgi:hypothetical protein
MASGRMRVCSLRRNQYVPIPPLPAGVELVGGDHGSLTPAGEEGFATSGSAATSTCCDAFAAT